MDGEDSLLTSSVSQLLLDKHSISCRPVPDVAKTNSETIDSDQITRGLEASSNLSRDTGHPGPDIKPCVATLLETTLSKGDFPDRNGSAVVIASELKRIGVDYDSALKRMEYWNRRNNPPLKPQELTKAAQNAYSRDYNYGCKNPILESFCMGQNVCPFDNRVRSKKNHYNDLKFLDYGWQRHLSSNQVRIYWIGLKYLESRRKVGKGGLIYANHKQIAEACGVSDRRIGKDLKVLQGAGLIKYEPGTPRKWEGKASEIRRIFPISRPTYYRVRLLKRSAQEP